MQGAAGRCRASQAAASRWQAAASAGGIVCASRWLLAPPARSDRCAGAAGRCRALQGAAGRCRALQGAAGRCRALQRAAGRRRPLQVAGKLSCSWDLLLTTCPPARSGRPLRWRCRAVQGGAGRCRALQGVAGLGPHRCRGTGQRLGHQRRQLRGAGAEAPHVEAAQLRAPGRRLLFRLPRRGAGHAAWSWVLAHGRVLASAKAPPPPPPLPPPSTPPPRSATSATAPSGSTRAGRAAARA
jgi:hypothetical protein